MKPNESDWKHLRYERIPDVAPVIAQAHWSLGGGYFFRHAYREIQMRTWLDEHGQRWGETRVAQEWIG